MTRRSDGLWQVKIKLKGMDNPRYFYGKTKAEVLRKINAFTEQHERGALFKDVAEEWWEEHERKIVPNTVKGYKPAMERAVAAFGDVPIQLLTPAQVADELEALASAGFADKTLHTQLMIYNLIFRYAVRKGYALTNSVRDLSAPNGAPKQKRTPPSPQDIERVKQSTDCTFGMFAFWAMYTGMRRGELLALEWQDVDIINRRVHITKSLYHVNNRPAVKLPKSAASMGYVPILDALLQKLSPKKRGLVFPNEAGEYMTETQFQRQWELYCKESGISATPHQFRHAYATMLFEADVPPEDMQVLLRHAQLATTMDVYREIRETKVKSIYEKVYGVDWV